MERGTFIVIEGTDGSGKGTQFKLLTDYLRTQGYEVATFDFPQYDQPSSYFVKKYLNGDYGTAEEIGPYTGSLFYALDRFEAAPKIRKALEEGKIVLANRFTGSNMGHQGTKFAHAEERRGYFIWLDNLEFEMLQIPRPTLSLVLRVPAEVAQQLVDQKEQRNYTDKKRDLHEADLSHMQRAVSVYDDLCQLFPKDFQRIDCVRGGELLSIETVHELIRQKIEPLLPPLPPKSAPPAAPDSLLAVPQPPSTTQPAAPTPTEQVPEQNNTQEPQHYYTPETLSETIKVAYKNHMDELFRLHGQIVQRLTTFLDDSSDKAEKVLWTSRAVIPVAAVPGWQPLQADVAINSLAQEYLPDNHANQTESLRLSNVSPRNEFDLIPDMLYPSSNLSITDIRTEVSRWSYEKRLNVLETYLKKTKQPQALEKITYSWDILCDADTFQIMQKLVPAQTQQELTPRYGFEVPKLIEEANLVDEFEQCFEISLKLHSLLQASGFTQEAQYAALLGHKMRWQLTITADKLRALYSTKITHPGAQELLQQMHEKLSETHPVLAEAFQHKTTKSIG